MLPIESKHISPFFSDALSRYWHLLLREPNVAPSEIVKAQQNLTFFLFRRLFISLYREIKLQRGTVFFVSNIRSDGLGDYFALLKAAHAFISRNPQIDVQVVFRHEQPLPQIDYKAYGLKAGQVHAFHEVTKIHILQTIMEGRDAFPTDADFTALTEERKNLETDRQLLDSKGGGESNVFSELLQECEKRIKHLEEYKQQKMRAIAIYQQMLQSEAIVHIALAINTFDNVALASKSLYFSEADNFTGIANALERNWYSMGLQPFEEGIFLTKTYPQDKSWIDSHLQDILWNGQQPTSDTIEIYKSQHSLHICYVTKIEIQQHIFICLVAILQKNDKRDIDIIIPKIANGDRQNLDKAWFVKQGIAEIIMGDFRQTIAKHGKRLRIIDGFPLPPSDFEKIIRMSESVVGCTGDLSLSDTLIAEKVPYYEQRKHKIEAWQAFVELAEYLHLPALKEYFRVVADYKEKTVIANAEQLCACLHHQQFGDQWKTFTAFIKRYECFEEALVGYVNRHLSPHLIIQERELALDYLQGRITTEEAYAKMSASTMI